MKQFITLTKKEFYESHATFRLYILIAVFLILGMMGPLMAMLTPRMLEMFNTADTGVTIVMPDPTWIDGFVQFFSGMGQLGMPVVVIIFCGIMSNEFSKGTLINLLTKGLKRHTVILAKFISASVLWTVSYFISLGVAYLYTAFLWEMGTISHLFLTFGSMWLFGIFVLSLLIFGGTLFGNFYGSLFTVIGVYTVLTLISIIPHSEKYNPMTLAGGTISLLTGDTVAGDFIPAVIICSGLTVACIVGAIWVFNRKKV